MNPKNARQKVASGKVNGWWGVEKFHGTTIPYFWFKIDVATTHMHEIPLMHLHEVGEETRMGDVVGTCSLVDLEVCENCKLTNFLNEWH